MFVMIFMHTASHNF